MPSRAPRRSGKAKRRNSHGATGKELGKLLFRAKALRPLGNRLEVLDKGAMGIER
jgi:hypothetical protein